MRPLPDGDQYLGFIFVGDAGARAGGLDDVDGVIAVLRDADRGGPGLAAIG